MANVSQYDVSTLGTVGAAGSAFVWNPLTGAKMVLTLDTTDLPGVSVPVFGSTPDFFTLNTTGTTTLFIENVNNHAKAQLTYTVALLTSLGIPSI